MNGQATNAGCRVSMTAPTTAMIEAAAGIANHQAEPRASQDRDSTFRSSAPTVRIAIAGYSGST